MENIGKYSWAFKYRCTEGFIKFIAYLDRNKNRSVESPPISIIVQFGAYLSNYLYLIMCGTVQNYWNKINLVVHSTPEKCFKYPITLAYWILNNQMNIHRINGVTNYDGHFIANKSHQHVIVFADHFLYTPAAIQGLVNRFNGIAFIWITVVSVNSY